MSKVYTIAVLAGSLRKDSINRKVALALAELAPANLKLNIVEIGDLPLYNEDIDGGTAGSLQYFPSAGEFIRRGAVRDPEYNRSVPAPLKNAIDVGSRPYGQSAWSGKPGRSSACRRVRSAVLAPTITCASPWCSSMCRACSSRKPTWAARAVCSTSPARSRKNQAVPAGLHHRLRQMG
jgi:hypothetical protein